MKTLKILGYTFDVQRPLKIGDGDALGRIKHYEHILQIEAGLEQQCARSTFLHECLHAIDRKMEIGLDEEQVRRLEVGLFALLHDNGVDLTPLWESLECDE